MPELRDNVAMSPAVVKRVQEACWVAHALLSLHEIHGIQQMFLGSLWVSLGNLCGGHTSSLRVSIFIMYISVVSTGCARGIRGKKMSETEMKDKTWSRGVGGESP